MTNTEIPRIEQWDVNGDPVWHICDSEGITAAVFHNRQFLRTVLTEVFGLGVFEPIPIVEINGKEVANEQTA